ncbi:MAG: TerB family tellurite resistance protein [Pseudomonadota bacterium]
MTLIDRITSLLGKPAEDEAAERARIAEAVRLCSACLLMEVVRADHAEDEAEITMALARVKAQFSLTDADAAALASVAKSRVESSVSLYEFTRTLHERMTVEQKSQLIAGMWAVAFADGHLDMHEDALVLKVADLLYVPRSEVMRLKAAAQNA